MSERIEEVFIKSEPVNPDLSEDSKIVEDIEILNEIDLDVVKIEKDYTECPENNFEILCDPLDVKLEDPDGEYTEEYLTENSIECYVYETDLQDEQINIDQRNTPNLKQNTHQYQEQYEYNNTCHYMEQEGHTCDMCFKTFNRKSTLYLHKQTHSGLKPYTCELCNKSFGFKHNLTKHKRNIHIGIRSYSCEFCRRAFKQKTDLDKHRLLHTGERPFQCIFCNKAFTQSSNLIKHITTHTGQKLFYCEFCGKGMNQRSKMEQHKICHTTNNNNISGQNIQNQCCSTDEHS